MLADWFYSLVLSSLSAVFHCADYQKCIGLNSICCEQLHMFAMIFSLLQMSVALPSHKCSRFTHIVRCLAFYNASAPDSTWVILDV